MMINPDHDAVMVCSLVEANFSFDHFTACLTVEKVILMLSNVIENITSTRTQAVVAL